MLCSAVKVSGSPVYGPVNRPATPVIGPAANKTSNSPCPSPMGFAPPRSAKAVQGPAVTPIDLLTTRPAGPTWRQRQQLAARSGVGKAASASAAAVAAVRGSHGANTGGGADMDVVGDVGAESAGRGGVGGRISPAVRGGPAVNEVDALMLEECREGGSSAASSDKSVATVGGMSAASSLEALSNSQGGSGLHSSGEVTSTAGRRSSHAKQDESKIFSRCASIRICYRERSMQRCVL